MKDNLTVPEVNPVEGFDPSLYARELENDDGTKSLYLDVKFRLLWFRLCYPNGKIVNEVINMDSKSAVVCCRLYADRSDDDKQYLSKSYAQRFFSEMKYGDRFLEFAETAAVGRALAYAGFGTQFCSGSEESGQCIDSPLMSLQESDSNLVDDNGESSMLSGKVNIASSNADYAMTVEKAKNVIVDFGFYKGKTLGEVASAKPDDVAWFAKNYVGNNPDIRIGAEKIIKNCIA